MSAPERFRNDGSRTREGMFGRTSADRWMCDVGHFHVGRQQAIRCNQRHRIYRELVAGGMLKGEAMKLARKRAR